MKKSELKICFAKEVFTVLFSGLIFSCSFLSLAQDQERVSINFRPGISFATTKVYDVEINTGYGFEGSVAYRFLPHLSVYAGWGWNSFSSPESFAGPDVHVEETGYMTGFQFLYPLGNQLPFEYFFRGGLIINHIEIENNEGEIIADSGHGLGFQVEAGLSFSLGEQWNLIPGIKYQTLSGKIAFEGVDYPVDLNYLSAGASVTYSF
jgi:hypothetical protein